MADLLPLGYSLAHLIWPPVKDYPSSMRGQVLIGPLGEYLDGSGSNSSQPSGGCQHAFKPVNRRVPSPGYQAVLHVSRQLTYSIRSIT